MTHKAHIDFETRSLIDLKARGLDVYANHLSTVPLCLGYAFNDEPAGLLDGLPSRDGDWLLCGSDDLDRLLQHVSDGELVYAHNAQFELAIWNNVCVKKYGWPKLKIEQLRCTMAMAFAMGLPGKLEELMGALRSDVRKDTAGHKTMLQISRPRAKGKAGKAVCPYCRGTGVSFNEVCSCVTWWTDTERVQIVFDYCRQDVEAERAAAGLMRELDPFEQRVWQVDQYINLNGVSFDSAAAIKALQIVDHEKERLNARMKEVTGGAVSSCGAVAALKQYVVDAGFYTAGVGKADILELLQDDMLPDSVRAALTLRQEAGKSSTAKLESALEAIGPGERIRYTTQYHSATTGRWGGRRVQLQNLARPPKALAAPELQDKILRAIAAGYPPQFIQMMYGAPMDVLVACIRAFFTAAPGCHLVAPDYSNIEGRKLAWLAGEDWKIQAFREQDDGTGPGIYQLTYSRCFGVDVDAVDGEQRQVGKVCELALGFGGGVGAFQSMARVYNVHMPDEQTDHVKTLWREQHPRTTGYWYALERAAIDAVMTGKQTDAGAEGRKVKFRLAGDHLWCRLPSARLLCYPYPEVRTMAAPWGQDKETLTFMAVPGDDPKARSRIVGDSYNTGRFARHKTYGGSLAENVTQASARDLLAPALVNLHDAGFTPVMHAHDEAVVEVPEDAPESVEKRIEELMCAVPPWAAGLPLVSSAWRGFRYRKD